MTCLHMLSQCQSESDDFKPIHEKETAHGWIQRGDIPPPCKIINNSVS